MRLRHRKCQLKKRSGGRAQRTRVAQKIAKGRGCARGRSGRCLGPSKVQHEAVQEELRQTKGGWSSIGKFRETAQSLKDAETEKTSTKQILAARDQPTAVCTEHNAALYRLNGEVVSHLEHEGFWSRARSLRAFYPAEAHAKRESSRRLQGASRRSAHHAAAQQLNPYGSSGQRCRWPRAPEWLPRCSAPGPSSGFGRQW